ncbi:hypothetical protein ACFVS2_26650 [Brevibacillus sp. NPDC058079]|uniref:hypothetical protein n=1 Tax=Brevibacillus sp. NPDC058079 TaxID=3346330 RepID=UPI0036EE384B
MDTNPIYEYEQKVKTIVDNPYFSNQQKCEQLQALLSDVAHRFNVPLVYGETFVENNKEVMSLFHSIRELFAKFKVEKIKAKKIVVEIETGRYTFSLGEIDGGNTELVSILRNLADDIENGEQPSILKDSEGEIVGKVTYEN